MRKVAIIGCGAIGSVLIEAIARGVVKCKLVALMDIASEKCSSISSMHSLEGVAICSDLDCLLKASPTLVVEAASQEAVKMYVPRVLEMGIDVVVLSVGALLDEKLISEIRKVMGLSKARVYIPSGAIAGLDAVKALSLTGIDRVVLKTTKNIRSFDRNTLRKLGVDVENVKTKTLIYSGKASEAVKLFPANINVVAALALASGVEPNVEIYADPMAMHNIHEIIVEGKASKIFIRVENVPHPQNPRTSYLAALSAATLLKRLCEEGVEVGT